jgi:hypothetical protein
MSSTVWETQKLGGEEARLSMEMPPRTLLYSLDPIGIGTPMVECFTSYDMRLAGEYDLSIKQLAAIAISGNLNPGDDVVRFLWNTYVLDGVSDRADLWVPAFEKATGRTDLRYLTLLPFRAAIPQMGLLSRHRKWCARCLEEWKPSRNRVYEPLLWRFEAVMVCTVHQIYLTSKCPRCRRQSQVLGFYSHPGYCQHCQSWLGTKDGTTSAPIEFSDECSIGRNIGELLKLLPHADPDSIRATLRQNLGIYCDQLATGNVSALADYIGHGHSNVLTWLDGTQVPRFKLLLDISKRFSVPLARLFDPRGPTSADIDRAKESIRASGSRNTYTFRRADEIKAALARAAKDPTRPSLLEVARQLGYTNTGRLQAADIELCRKIRERFRDSERFYRVRGRYAVRKCDPAVVEMALKDTLRSKEDKSLSQIAFDLGYSNSGTIRKLFPDLCAAVASKNERLRAKRRKALHRGLEEALVEDPPPSLNTVTHRLGYSTSTVLRENEPELMNRLAERYRQSFRSRGSELERRVEPMLAEDPVPSVKEVCIRLDITKGFLLKYASGLVTKIAQMHQEWKTRDVMRRRAQLVKAVRDIAFDLDRKDVYPSAKQILSVLPNGYTGGWKFLYKAIVDSQEEVRRRTV